MDKGVDRSLIEIEKREEGGHVNMSQTMSDQIKRQDKSALFGVEEMSD